MRLQPGRKTFNVLILASTGVEAGALVWTRSLSAIGPSNQAFFSSSGVSMAEINNPWRSDVRGMLDTGADLVALDLAALDAVTGLSEVACAIDTRNPMESNPTKQSFIVFLFMLKS
jgi:methionine synthase I (cobalamin-dependent)